MEKRVLLGIVALGGFILLGAILFTLNIKKEQPVAEPNAEPNLGISSPGANLLNGYTHDSTTTPSNGLMPVKIFAYDPRRLSAVIINDSDTPIYLTFPKNLFSDPLAASTTAGLNGFRLNANGGYWQTTNDDLVVSEVWASSTATGKKILFASSTQ